MDTIVHQFPPSSRSANAVLIGGEREPPSDVSASLQPLEGTEVEEQTLSSRQQHPCMRRCGPIAGRTTIAVGCIRDYYFPRTTRIEYRWVDGSSKTPWSWHIIRDSGCSLSFPMSTANFGYFHLDSLIWTTGFWASFGEGTFAKLHDAGEGGFLDPVLERREALTSN